MEESSVTCVHCGVTMNVDQNSGAVYCSICGYYKTNCESTCRTCCSPGFVFKDNEENEKGFSFLCSNPKCPRYKIELDKANLSIYFDKKLVVYLCLMLMKIVKDVKPVYMEELHHHVQKTLINNILKEACTKDKEVLKILEENVFERN